MQRDLFRAFPSLAPPDFNFTAADIFDAAEAAAEAAAEVRVLCVEAFVM